jgi:hypothetical protein
LKLVVLVEMVVQVEVEEGEELAIEQLGELVEMALQEEVEVVKITKVLVMAVQEDLVQEQ